MFIDVTNIPDYAQPQADKRTGTNEGAPGETAARLASGEESRR